MLRKVFVHFLDQFNVVGAVRVQPEYRRSSRDPGSAYTKFDPVLDRLVFGLAHTEDVALFYHLLHKGGARFVYNANRPVARGTECLIVGAIFFGFLGHQSYV